MSNPDQLDIKELSPGRWRLEADFNRDFVEWLKRRVPKEDRSYEDATNFWEIRGDKYIPSIEGIGTQKFSFVTKIFRRDGKLVWRNCKTGREEVQEQLFKEQH